MAPQHEATGGRVRIGLCPVEHTVWFDVRGVLRFCAGFSCDESARRGAGGADMVKVQRPWQRPGGLTERMPGSWSCEFPALRDYVRKECARAADGEGVHQNLHVHMIRPSADEGEEFLQRCQREAQLSVAADFDKRRQACAHSLSSTVSEVDGNFSDTTFQAGINSVAPRPHGQGAAAAVIVARAATELALREAEQARKDRDVALVAGQAVPANVRSFLADPTAGVSDEALAPVAFTVHAVGTDGKLKSAGGVLGVPDESIESTGCTRRALVGLCQLLHLHVVAQDIGETSVLGGTDDGSRVAGECCRSLPELAQVALHDHSLLHACVRGLAGGHPDFAAVPPSASNSSAMAAAVPQVFSDSHLKSVLAPFAITEQLRKISDPSKFNHVPGMFAHAQNDATPLATQNMLSKLGISSSRVVAVKRDIHDMQVALSSGGLVNYASDSVYFCRFDNLGFKRGGKDAGYFQTVTMHWEEVTMQQLKAILGREELPTLKLSKCRCGRNEHGVPLWPPRRAAWQPAERVVLSHALIEEKWLRKDRADVVTVQALEPSERAWTALDMRIQQEISAAINLSVLIESETVGEEEGLPDLCTHKEFYGMGVEEEVSDEYLTFEQEALDKKIASGSVLDLFKRNNMQMDEVMMNDLAKVPARTSHSPPGACSCVLVFPCPASYSLDRRRVCVACVCV